MATHVCDICGTDFAAKNNQKRCSSECQKLGRRRYALAWYHDNVESCANRNKTYRDASPERQLLKGAKWRSHERGEICDLDESDITIPERCPILGIPLDTSGRYGPTLDRKNSSLGYIKGNVWVVSRLANQMKSDSTPEEQRKFAEWVKTQVHCPPISTNC